MLNDSAPSFFSTLIDRRGGRERRAAASVELSRLNSREAALEALQASVMLVSNDLVITYMNSAATALMQAAEPEMRREVPGFDARKLIGSNVDIFQGNPSLQRRMSAVLEVPEEATIKLGTRTFDVRVSSLKENATRIGFCIEWSDADDRIRSVANTSLITALGRSQAVIEFALDGRVIHANENFLTAMGYTLEEVVGQHHSLFVDAAYRQSAQYKAFWEKLGRGEYDAGQYKRIAKGGREVWLQASYNPVVDAQGKALKVVKSATDITEQKLQNADYTGQLAAIGKAQAVIEFSLEGRILTANPNFLNAVGYSIDEIRGQHHSLFVDPVDRQSADYRIFWDKLGRGDYDAGQYKRIAKGGGHVWLQASYNPIMDMNGKPFKVVKYATDITEQVRAAELLRLAVQQIQAVVSSAQANDLSERVPLEGKAGDIQGLCAGVNGLLDMMVGVVSGIVEASSTIATGAREISMGNTDLSQRTEEQASSLEQTAASLEELTATVRQNADNAQQANKLANSASETAIKGGIVVGDVVRTMEGISQASRKITDIHRRHRRDRLPDQHSRAECGSGSGPRRRAGQGLCRRRGRGAQPRQRSANAAKEIKSLISESGGKVESGSRLVAAAGRPWRRSSIR